MIFVVLASGMIGEARLKCMGSWRSTSVVGHRAGNGGQIGLSCQSAVQSCGSGGVTMISVSCFGYEGGSKADRAGVLMVGFQWWGTEAG